MIQAVNASDKYASQLFRWDKENQTISLPHGAYIWFAKLGDDGFFTIIDSKPKP